jgi:hypothetical protein
MPRPGPFGSGSRNTFQGGETVLSAPRARPRSRARFFDGRDACDALAGQRICGRATQLDLHEEGSSDTFTPAVPFVTAFSVIAAAAGADAGSELAPLARAGGAGEEAGGRS